MKFGPFGMTLFEYLLGALALKYQIFTHIFRAWERIPKFGRGVLTVALLLGLLYGFRIRCYGTFSFLEEAQVGAKDVPICGKTFCKHLADAHVFLFDVVRGPGLSRQISGSDHGIYAGNYDPAFHAAAMD